jgi:hypothetical protein
VAVPAGRSVAASARNVGVAAAPVVGPAKTNAADCVVSVADKVPLVVTGEPATVNRDGNPRATEVTEPVAGLTHDGFAAAPPVCRCWPAVPGARGVHPVALRYKIEP